jgi:hypothetical protein
MGCLPLALQESPGLLRYEVRPGAACTALSLRIGCTRGTTCHVKAEPERAVHPSDRFHRALIPSLRHLGRVRNRPAHIVVDHSIACSASVGGMPDGYVEVA